VWTVHYVGICSVASSCNVVTEPVKRDKTGVVDGFCQLLPEVFQSYFFTLAKTESISVSQSRTSYESDAEEQ